MILHRDYTGGFRMVTAKGSFPLWWAVEVSNLRPQQCECQIAPRRHGVSLGSDPARTPGNGMREQLFTLELHRPRLLQDETQTYDSKALSRWFASRPNARQEAREVAASLASRDATPVLQMEKK